LYGEPQLDLGLVDSIAAVGILDPITVTDEGEILSGNRRYVAYKHLLEQKQEFSQHLVVRIVPALTSPPTVEDSLEHERIVIEGNRQRVKTESQKDAEVAALLRIESELAKQRQEAGVRLKPDEGGKAVEKVAKITGESPDTVRKRAAIHEEKIPAEKRNKQSTNAAHLEIQQERRRKGFKKNFPEYVDKSNQEVDAAIAEKFPNPTILRKHLSGEVVQGSTTSILTPDQQQRVEDWAKQDEEVSAAVELVKNKSEETLLDDWSPKGWSSWTARQKHDFGKGIGCGYCTSEKSARSCPAHGWKEKRQNRDGDAPSENLTETFYVTRRKLDGAFYQESPRGNNTGTFVANISSGNFYHDATHYEDADDDFDGVLVWAVPDRFGTISKSKRHKLQRHEWEWVKVQAKYELTAVTPTAPPAQETQESAGDSQAEQEPTTYGIRMADYAAMSLPQRRKHRESYAKLNAVAEAF